MAGLASIGMLAFHKNTPEEAKLGLNSESPLLEFQAPWFPRVQSLLVITLLGVEGGYVMVPGITLLRKPCLLPKNEVAGPSLCLSTDFRLPVPRASFHKRSLLRCVPALWMPDTPVSLSS